MNALFKKVIDFVREEDGTELVEWGLVAGLIIVLAAGVFALIGGNLDTIFTALQAVTQEAADNVPAAP